MDYITSAYWDIGGRNNNEDSLVIQQGYIGRKGIFLGAVADGIGGLEDGEVASGFLIERLVEVLFQEIKEAVNKNASIGCIKRLFLQKIYETHNEVLDYSNGRNKFMGTTLSMLFIIENKYLIVNIGDSAIYKFRRHRGKRVTPAHINSDGSLNRCIGSGQFKRPYVKVGRMMRNTGFLICSDGFHKRDIPKGAVFAPKEIIVETQIEKRLMECARKVRFLGEGDNISAIYIKCG